jgi:hypothetical protein
MYFCHKINDIIAPIVISIAIKPKRITVRGSSDATASWGHLVI